MAITRPWRLSIGVKKIAKGRTIRDYHAVECDFDEPRKPLSSLDHVKETAKKWKANCVSLGF